MFEPADDQGADAVGVTSGIQRVFVHEDEAERAAQSGQHVEGRGLEGAVGVVGQERRDERGVGGVAPRQLAAVGVALEPALDEVTQFGGVREVAVVGQRHGATGVAAEGGLGVLPRRAAGGGVAAVAYCEVAAQRRQRALVEDLGYQAHVLVDQQPLPVGRRDAGRLLPAVLEGIEAVVAWRRPHRGAQTPKTPQASCGPFSLGICKGEVSVLKGNVPGSS